MTEVAVRETPENSVNIDLVDPRRLERVVSIHCYGRSGSNFLSSLLDSHPQVLTTPGVQLCSFYRFWEEYGDQSAIMTLGAFLKHFEAIYKVHQPANIPFFSPKPLKGLPSRVDERLLIDSLLLLLTQEVGDVQRQPISRKYFFQALHVAYAIALGRTVRWESAIIVFNLHEPLQQWARYLVEDFPDAYFLHMIRKPVQTLGSWYTMMGKGLTDTPFGPRLARHGMKAMLTQAKPIFAASAERSRAVKLEDLHTSSRDTLQRICTWLAIEWNDSLMTSTFNGIEHIDPSIGNDYKGFQTYTISRKKFECYSWIDMVRLKFLYSHLYTNWNYQHPFYYRVPLFKKLVLKLMIFPFKIERNLWKTNPKASSFEELGIAADRYLEMRRELRSLLTRDMEDGARFLRLV